MMTYAVCYISTMIVMSLLRHSEAYYKYTSVIITNRRVNFGRLKEASH